MFLGDLQQATGIFPQNCAAFSLREMGLLWAQKLKSLDVIMSAVFWIDEENAFVGLSLNCHSGGFFWERRSFIAGRRKK